MDKSLLCLFGISHIAKQAAALLCLRNKLLPAAVSKADGLQIGAWV